MAKTADDDGFVADDDGFVADAPSETRLRSPKDARMVAAQVEEVEPGAAPEAPTKPGMLGDVANYVADAGVALGKGAVSGATADFDDELAGAANSLGAVADGSTGDDAQAERQRAYEATGEVPSDADAYQGAVGNTYLKMRDAMRADKKATEQANPIAYPVGQVVGSMLLPAGKLAKGAGWAMNALRMGLAGGAMGAAAGAGSSERPGLESLKDAVAPGAVGGTLGAIAGGVATPLAKYYGLLSQKAKSAAAQMAAEKAAAAMNSARGKLGGEVSAGSRTLEVLENALSNPQVTPEMREAARALLASEQGAALRNGVVSSSVDRAGGQLGRIDAAKMAAAEAAKLASPEALQAASGEILAKPAMKSAIGKIGARILPTVGLGAAGYLAGDALGHDVSGTAAGGMLGVMLSATKGQPGRILSNAVRSPAFRNALGEAGQALADRAPAFATQAASTAAPTSSSLAEYLRLLQEKETK